MKLTLVLLFCISAVQAQTFEYDYDEIPTGQPETTDAESPNAGTLQDPRGHRPIVDSAYYYRRNQPVYTGQNTDGRRMRYRTQPTPSTQRSSIVEERVSPDAGGCKHLSTDKGVLCPTGCELRTSLLKEEKNTKLIIDDLTLRLSNLTRSTNTIHVYVENLDHEMQRRQTQYSGNNQIVSSYNAELEDRFALIKDKVESTLPSTIRMMRSVVQSLKAKLENLRKAVLTQKEFCKRPCTVTCNIPVVTGKECNEIYEKGGRESQMYLINPDSFKAPYKVYCDMTTAEGGWALIQSRQDGSVDFGRSWDAYKNGFGNIAFDVGKGFCDTPGEYWLGNDRISQLTKLKPTELFFEMQDWEDEQLTAHYTKFRVQNEVNNYRLFIDGYSGTAGNALLEGAKMLSGVNKTMTIHQNMMFSTYNRDNDAWEPGNPAKQCAREDGGGWWYNRCHSANPNGRYYWGGQYTKEMAKHGTDDGIVWMDARGSWYSLKKMSMKIRPQFPTSGTQQQIVQTYLEH
ncbi:fibrinogen beta chain [Rhincodon typus]|uniref:fibrinogen beta chain n=1 Tax=Rhincodon typus TaxID=259920 RepID=UPI0020305AC7|nr:fibrinogen beta chain [Rhincodon typus]